jgi:hypothetical protein
MPHLSASLPVRLLSPTADVNMMHVKRTAIDLASTKTPIFWKKLETSSPETSWLRRGLFSSEPNMVDDVPLRTAVHTVWSLYLAKHRDVDAADSRHCLLQGRWEARVSDADELTGFGLAYLERLPEDEC